MTSKEEGKVVGIDVGKAWLDVNVYGEDKVNRWPNDSLGISQIGEKLSKMAIKLVVVEASGGWERSIHAELSQRGLGVAVVNPTRVRSFARAMGQLAKTDPIDARNIAELGVKIEPQAQKMVSAAREKLAALVTRRYQLITIVTMEKNRAVTAPELCWQP